MLIVGKTLVERDAARPAMTLEDLLDERPAAIAEVRSWIAGLVRGGGWKLADPEAAIQEALVRALHLARSRRIREDTDLRSFIWTLTRHTCTDLYRRERLRASVEAASPRGAPGPGAGNPHAELERKERRERLRYLYQALPEECRRLWRWVYGDGLGAAEVAARLGISVGNTRVRVHRCLEKAREIHRSYRFGGAVAPAEVRTHGT
jgi:RNA polymerase sigma factor (sigma-70 family)